MHFFLSFVPAGFALLAAIIQFGLANGSVGWAARIRRWLNLALFLVIAAGIVATNLINHRENIRAEEERLISEQATYEREERARQERDSISNGIKELASLVGAIDPGLTDEQAINTIGNEIHRLREKASKLEGDLEGLRRYSGIAQLNIFGLTGKFGEGLSESSPLSRALDGAYEEIEDGVERTYRPNCSAAGVARLKEATSKFPDFPFAHWALAMCRGQEGDPLWRTHAEQALEILEHTTRIAGHHAHHDEVRAKLTRFLSTD